MNLESSTLGDISFVLVYFNANAYDPEQLIFDLKEIPAEEYEKAKDIMSYLLEKRRLGAREFREATAATARDDATARLFFGDVYRYAFEGGAMPDIADYWNR